ncbi:hypothetical protein CAPTEDRAFT_215615 [Capitella teleta]|uniref:adenylate cyclase n=1 Tax=Capitella teleta TaxID=283909 RepID=R7V5J5_CAPTE|nr:hypothetical protein CAPTEDRAFT_215615 [Capitella teleta]|eukprot:ELU11060.1 hypothetical protein CAPTEDRAFT_215615 [Capitella teleta]
MATEELYHESYGCICVMFASIPNFWDFYRQNTISKHGIECIKILNEIICDFDQLLYKPKFSSVEKIKTIGSTYMAATGDVQNEKHQILVLTDFALTMTSLLSTINKNTLNQFKLRIGINHGPAVAGVIGAEKPQYDIWGDTVNVASRMDSTGVEGFIQCPEDTAQTLLAGGYKCSCRGDIQVKGKQKPITTYLCNLYNLNDSE